MNNSSSPFTVTIEVAPYEGGITYGNFTRLSRGELDVTIDIGVIDAHEVAYLAGKIKSKEIKELPPVKATIVQRIALSASTFRKFHEQVQFIYDGYEKQGLFEKVKQ